MSVTYGFYNSIGGDRRYNADQMSMLFDGLINDGVFMSIGDALMVTAASGMNINIGEGRAWFNRTWTNNDAQLQLTVDLSEVVLHRIDTVVLEINSENATRANVIKIIKGTPASSPVAPTLTETEFIHQHPICHIYVEAGVNEIIQANITNTVGTSVCPFVTGILETVNINSLLAQWESEFQVWFATLEDILDENTAANLLNLINDKMYPVAGGANTFAGNGSEKTIPHGLSITPTLASVTPLSNPEGYLGEIWTRIDATNLYVGNSGSHTGSFSWVLF